MFLSHSCRKTTLTSSVHCATHKVRYRIHTEAWSQTLIPHFTTEETECPVCEGTSLRSKNKDRTWSQICRNSELFTFSISSGTFLFVLDNLIVGTGHCLCYDTKYLHAFRIKCAFSNILHCRTSEEFIIRDLIHNSWLLATWQLAVKKGEIHKKTGRAACDKLQMNEWKY